MSKEDKKYSLLVIVLIVITILFVGRIEYLDHRLEVADNYIEALENDNPDYIDTTSGGDEYSNYYSGL